MNEFDKVELANHNLPLADKVTVSIGITHINGPFMDTTLLDHADKALYHAKDTGRNKAVFYQDIVTDSQTK